jgi:homopolymeric O-antigen transport system permease protein
MTIALDSFDSSRIRRNRAGDRPRLLEELRELSRFRDLLVSLVHRDLTVRYKRSYLGFFWTMLHPLLLMLIFVIIFASLFRFAIPHYETYFLSEYLPWNFFAQTTIAAMASMGWNAALMKRLRVPKSIFTLSIVVSGMINLILAIGPLFLIMWIVGAPIRPSVLFLPVSFLILGVFTLGVTLALSSISVFFTDVREVYAGVVTTAWMYLTPIMYPIWIVPENYRWILKFNPMYYLLEIVRIPIYNGEVPTLKLVTFAVAMAIGSITVGWLTYQRLAPKFYPHL